METNFKYVINPKYYYITSAENKQYIIENGIKSDGRILIFLDITTAKSYAILKMNIENYSVFEIDCNGINTYMIDDNQGEYGIPFKYYIEQVFIKTEFLTFIEEGKLDSRLVNYGVEFNDELFNEYKNRCDSNKFCEVKSEEFAIDTLRIDLSGLDYINKRFKANYTLLDIDVYNNKYK